MTVEKMLITEKRHCGKNLVEETLKENGVAGARLMSGGFGGCSINLIEDDSVNNVIENISEKYKSQFGTEMKVYRTKISDGIKEYKENEDDKTFKFYFDLRVNDNPNNTIYIIDEASMISNVYGEPEFFRFGSGFLLQDLLKYINIDCNDHNKKILFIGDNAQLPPIGMNFSPARGILPAGPPPFEKGGQGGFWQSVRGLLAAESPPDDSLPLGTPRQLW